MKNKTNRPDSEISWKAVNDLRRSISDRLLALGEKSYAPPRRIRRIGLRHISFWLIVLSLVLDIVAVLSYTSDLRYFQSLADEIVDGEYRTDRETLDLFVDYAYNDLERPTYNELKSPLVKLYYKYNPFHPSARDVVTHGCDYRGGCGSSSRVVLALLDASGMKSRPLILRDKGGNRLHAVVNAYIDARWAVADPLYGLVFFDSDGELVTAEQLRRDHFLFLANAARNPAYPHGVFNYDNFALMNWNKVPVVLPAIRWVLSHTIGEERTNSISRPRIWMYPLPAFAACFTIFALVLAAVLSLRAWTRGTKDAVESA